MTVKPILVWPDPALAKVSVSVDLTSDDTIKSLVQDMFDSMYAANGIGLAAPQIGVHKRVVLAGLGPNHDVVVLINPTLMDLKGKVEATEGCLSVPGFEGKVTRAESCTVFYQDLEGQHLVMYLTGMDAIVVQHEVDHLLGVVYVQHLGKVKRDFIRKKLAKR